MAIVRSFVKEPSAATRAGAELRTARSNLGLELHDVGLKLRIRPAYLEALEDGRIASLPGRAYAVGYVRTYARFLGLDAEETVRRFKREAAECGRQTRLVFPVPLPERTLPTGAMMLLGLLLAVGVYVGWYHLSAEGRLPAEMVTAIPERLAPLAEQALPPHKDEPPPVTAIGALPTTGNAATALLSPALDDPAAPDLLRADPAPPAMAISPTAAAAAQISPPSAQAPAVAASGATSPADAPPGRIVVRASADAWVMVKDHDGSVLLSRTMKAGESWPIPARSDLLMTTGNAGGTELLVDGATTAGLGGSGTVRRDMPLDPDAIKEGKLAGTSTPQLASTRPHQ